MYGRPILDLTNKRFLSAIPWNLKQCFLPEIYLGHISKDLPAKGKHDTEIIKEQCFKTIPKLFHRFFPVCNLSSGRFCFGINSGSCVNIAQVIWNFLFRQRRHSLTYLMGFWTNKLGFGYSYQIPYARLLVIHSTAGSPHHHKHVCKAARS